MGERCCCWKDISSGDVQLVAVIVVLLLLLSSECSAITNTDISKMIYGFLVNVSQPATVMDETFFSTLCSFTHTHTHTYIQKCTDANRHANLAQDSYIFYQSLSTYKYLRFIWSQNLELFRECILIDNEFDSALSPCLNQNCPSSGKTATMEQAPHSQ